MRQLKANLEKDLRDAEIQLKRIQAAKSGIPAVNEESVWDIVSSFLPLGTSLGAGNIVDIRSETTASETGSNISDSDDEGMQSVTGMVN